MKPETVRRWLPIIETVAAVCLVAGALLLLGAFAAWSGL